jgi:hypothetical protein
MQITYYNFYNWLEQHFRGNLRDFARRKYYVGMRERKRKKESEET